MSLGPSSMNHAEQQERLFRVAPSARRILPNHYRALSDSSYTHQPSHRGRLDYRSQHARKSTVSLVEQLKGKSPREQANILIKAAHEKSPELRNFQRWDIVNWNDADLKNISGLKSLPLNKISMAGADLSGVNLQNANLRGANLRGAMLSGANLAGADLSGADLTRIKAQGTSFAKATMTGTITAGANFQNCNLDGANMSNIKGRGMTIAGDSNNLNLQDARIPEATLKGTFGGLSLSGDLLGAKLADAIFVDSQTANLELAATQPNKNVASGGLLEAVIGTVATPKPSNGAGIPGLRPALHQIVQLVNTGSSNTFARRQQAATNRTALKGMQAKVAAAHSPSSRAEQSVALTGPAFQPVRNNFHKRQLQMGMAPV